MANTITNTRLFCGEKEVVQYLTIAYVDSQETDYVIYDSSDVASTLGKTDTSNCKINSIYATVNGIGTAALPQVKLEFDATTDVLALNIPANTLVKNDFRPIGGLKNTSGSGKTGDITLTTLGLAAGDTLVVVLNVDPR